MCSLDTIYVFASVAAGFLFEQRHVFMGYSPTFQAKEQERFPRTLGVCNNNFSRNYLHNFFM
jgi:hypothetical protein